MSKLVTNKELTYGTKVTIEKGTEAFPVSEEEANDFLNNVVYPVLTPGQFDGEEIMVVRFQGDDRLRVLQKKYTDKVGAP